MKNQYRDRHGAVSKSFYILGATLLAAHVALGADIGTAFTYQGSLEKPAGTPVTNTCDFRFGLWKDSISVLPADQVGTIQTVTGVSVGAGVFTTVIDFGINAIDGTDRWLAIEVRCTGDSDFVPLNGGVPPRVKMTPAPHALALPGMYTQQNPTSPNILGGYSGNIVAGGVVGATISGGGALDITLGECQTLCIVSPDSCSPETGPCVDVPFVGQCFTGGMLCMTDSDCGGTVGSCNLADTNSGICSRGSGTICTADNDCAAGERCIFTTISGENHVTADFGTIGGGAANIAGSVPASVAASGSGSGSTIGGGSGNQASGGYSTIGGGKDNKASGNYSTVGGGWLNEAAGAISVVAGGKKNYAGLEGSAVLGGYNNRVESNGSYSAIVGGENNSVKGYDSAVVGGIGNVNQGNYSVILGGQNVSIGSGKDYAMAFGLGVTINTEYRVAFFHGSDSGRVGINRDTSDGISYPLHVGTSTSNGNGAYVSNSGVWTNGSDRNSKENFVDIDKRELLERVVQLPVTRWRYKGEGEGTQHVGPVAQDFYAAFGLGDSKTHIGTIDSDGVALAAIQGLYEIVQEKDCDIDELRNREAAKDQRINELEARLAAIEALMARFSNSTKEGAR